MGEQFMDTSNILGVLPRETVPAETAVENQDQVDTENSNESDFPRRFPPERFLGEATNRKLTTTALRRNPKPE